MPSVVNTNVLSLNAQRQLNKSQLAQNTAMERLSSGLRINSAKDDAAGLAISTGMSSQIRGLNQAVRNANDGISMAQTAEGSMDEMTNILQRMRELGVQAANDTNSASNRASIQIEVDQLYSELDRIAGTTSFNGINLLDGSNSSTSLQIGSEANQTLSFSISAVTTKDLNLNAVSGLGELNGGRANTATAMTSTAVLLNDVLLSGTAAAGANMAADTKSMINATTGLHGVTASAYNTVEGTAGQTGVTTGLTINTVAISNTTSMSNLVDTINLELAGVTATLNSSGALVLSNDTGNQIDITAGTANSGLVQDDYQGFVSLTSADGAEITLAANTPTVTAAVGSAQIQQMGFMVSNGSDKLTGDAVVSTAVLSTDQIQINGVDLGAVTGTTAADKAFAINAISDESGVSASATTTVEYKGMISQIAIESILTINGVTIDFTAAANSVDSLDDFITVLNASGIQGVVASASATTGNFILTSQAGSDIIIESITGDVFQDTAGGNVDTNGATQFTSGAITLTGKDGADVVVTSKAVDQATKDTALAKIGVTDVGGSETAVGTGLSVTSVIGANNTIERIDDALKKISDGRANLGAIQNRLSSTISNLANVSQNISAANSRIRDADFAMETSALSKSQILQQAGTAMLSQANASTQNVLSLLG